MTQQPLDFTAPIPTITLDPPADAPITTTDPTPVLTPEMTWKVDLPLRRRLERAEREVAQLAQINQQLEAAYHEALAENRRLRNVAGIGPPETPS